MTQIKTHRPAGPKPGATVHPLGPLLYRVRARRPGRARALASAVFIGCAAMLSVAAWVTPDGSGPGARRLLGSPQCLSLTLFGYPCPTCGMTTAFAHTVRGELGSAFHAQPAGLALAMATIFATGLSLGVVVTGKVWGLNWYRVSPERVTLAVVVLVLGSWVYKLAASVMSGTLPVGRGN